MTDISATAEFIVEASQTLGRRPIDEGALDAQRIPSRSDAYVAVSASGELHLLLEIGEGTYVEERRQRALRVLMGDNFTIFDSYTREIYRRRFAVVALEPDNDHLITSFAVVAASLLSMLPPQPTASDVVAFLDGLVELVAPRSGVAAATVVGLWGELWVISRAQDPADFAAAWHSSPSDRFDFSFPTFRLEVKTTTGTIRAHEFSLDQLALGDEKPAWVASVQAVSDPSGQSIIDLLEAIVRLLPADLGSRVTRIALQTLAGDLESSQDYTFAPVGSEPALFYFVGDIPRPQVLEGSGVSGVRFRVDLAPVPPVERSLHDFWMRAPRH